MPGRTEAAEADGEWSDASDDAVKSGSATDASKTEGDDTVGRTLGLGRPSLMAMSSSALGRKDPVHSVLDKIDAELAAMSSLPSKGGKGSARLPATSRPKSSLPPLLASYNTLFPEKGGPAQGAARKGGAASEKEDQHIAGSAEIYTDATLTDDDARPTRATEEFLSDLDSVVAQQIDSRFKEIMLRKKGTTTPPPPPQPSSSLHPPGHPTVPILTLSPPTPLSTYLDTPPLKPSSQASQTTRLLSGTGYGTDNDSIKTEDFESRFQNLIITDGNTSGESAKRSRQKRAKNGSGSSSSSLKKAGLGGGFGSGASASASAKSGCVGGGGVGAARGGGGVGKVSFDVSPKEKDDGRASGSSSLKLNGLNRVLQHSMKSLGETSKEPVESTSSALVSLPPSGRSRSVSPERLMSDRPKPALTVSDKTGSGVGDVATTTTTTTTTIGKKKTGDHPDSASEEIERQSARIQREMERERRCRSVSPVRMMMSSLGATGSPISSLPPRAARAPTPARLQTSEFQTDTLTMASLGSHLEQADKMIVGQELKTLRGALLTTKLQLKEAEKDVRTMRDKAEEARSELMLIDFKRTTATKDLQRLSEDVERKRSTLHGYDSEMASRRTELRDMESLGFSKDQAKVLQEENAGLKQRLRTVQGLELERDELSRQLSAAKEDLLREQKQSRLQREEMNEEMETLTSRLEEAQHGWGMAQQQLTKLEAAFRTMEREKNELIQEQSKEYSALRSQSVQESRESREMLAREVDLLNKEVQDQRVHMAGLQADCKAHEDKNQQLREEIVSLTNEISQEQAARAVITEEHRKTLQMLRRETDSAMLQLRESLFLEKQRALEDLRAEIEQERRDSAYRADDRMAHMLAQNADLIAEKDQEILLLQEKVSDLQELQHATESRMQENIELKIREAVARERVAMDTETQWQLRSERETLARDSKQRINEMQMTLDRERETTQRLIHELEHLKKELEEQRRHSREMVQEKAAAVAKAKDEVKVQSKTELETMREQLKQDMQKDIDRLQSQLKKAEEEGRSLRADRQSLESRERDKTSALERAEKTVITEINEECRRSAAMLGITPRQVQLSNVTDSTSSRAQITAALANLRAVNEELRNHVQEVTSELEACRATIASLQKENAEAVERVRLELETQKTLELEKVKEKLIKEHTEELARVAQASARQSLANTMVSALRRKDAEIDQLKQAVTVSREQAADKYARLYQNQLAKELEKSQALLLQSGQEQKRVNEQQQREINRLEKEVQRLAVTQNNKDVSSPSPQQQQQQYLQARIKQLNAENNELRRKHLLSKHNVSVPDLSSAAALGLSVTPRRAVSPGPGVQLQGLEERLRRGEKEALMAEERARLKQTVLCQKMNDMAKLQNTLSDQNQELLRLERAYTQLHRQYNDTPTLPVNHILNNTR